MRGGDAGGHMRRWLHAQVVTCAGGYMRRAPIGCARAGIRGGTSGGPLLVGLI
jgi:hypothetical protein